MFHSTSMHHFTLITKKQFAFLAFLFLLLLHPMVSMAQWQQTKGPAGGFTVAMHAKGDTLFAGNFEHYTLTNTDPNAGTLYRSVDHGLNWERDSVGFHGVPIDFTENGQSLFVVTSTDGIFRTNNNGNSWNSLPNTNTFSPQKIITVDGVIYVGTIENGVYKSIDNGNTFTDISNGLPIYATISAIGAIDSVVFVSAVDFLGHAQGIFKLTNGDTTWVSCNGNLISPIPFVTSFATFGNKLFAVESTGVYYTSNFGLSWIFSGNGINGSGDIIKLINDSILLTTSFSAVATEGWQTFRSDDIGNTWYKVGNGIPGTEKPFTFTSIGNEIFTGLGFYGSVYKSTDLGVTFQESNTNLGNVDTKDVFEYANMAFSASLSIAGVHVSVDGGNTWTASGVGLPNGNGFGAITGGYKTCNTFASNSNYLFVGMDYEGVYRSSDTAQTWEPANAGLGPFALNINYIATKDSIIFAATYDDVYVSYNNGANWTPCTAVFGSRKEIRALAVKGNDVFAGIEYFGIFRSSDNGNTWINLPNGLPNLVTPNEIIVRGNDLILAAGSGIYISSDNGNTWVAKNNGLPALSYNCRTITAKNDTLVTATYDVNNFRAAGIFMSNDYGNTWIENDNNIRPFAIRGLTIIGNKVFAATETESVWSTSLSAGPAVAVFDTSFDIKHVDRVVVYPNPAKDKLQMRIISQQNETVLVQIISQNGKVLFQQQSNLLQGIYTQTIDISWMSSGSYFLKINNGNEKTTVKFEKM